MTAASVTGVSVPSWPAVAVSFVLVLACVAVVARERLGLARGVTIAAIRAAVQLVAVGALLQWLFQHAGLAGAPGWVGAIVGNRRGAAAGRGCGLPGRRAGLAL